MRASLLILALATASSVLGKVSFGGAAAEEEVELPEEEDNCMPLNQCEPLMYLVNAVRHNQIPATLTRSQVIAQLRDSACSASQTEILVNCPLSQEEMMRDLLPLVGLRQAGVTVGRESGSSSGCEGSVRVHSAHPEAGVRVHRIAGRRNNVARIPGYSVPDVFRVEVQGNCCWRLYPNAFRRGRALRLEAGYDDRPANFRSMEKFNCP